MTEQDLPGADAPRDPYATTPGAGGAEAHTAPGNSTGGNTVPGQPSPGQPVAGQAAPTQPPTGDAKPLDVPSAGAAPAPAPARRGLLVRILTGLLTALVASLAWWGVRQAFDKGSEAITMKPGNCITVTKGADGASDEPHKVDCSEGGKPTYTVVKKLTGSTCAEPYASFEYMDPKAKDKARYTYCLMENLEAGSCYQGHDEKPGELVGLTTVTCTDPKAEFLVAKAVRGTDTSTCSADQKAFTYTDEPRTTYCLTAPR